MQKLKQTAMAALKNKDDTEMKCQQKISDMVALMEKHKVIIILNIFHWSLKFYEFSFILMYSLFFAA